MIKYYQDHKIQNYEPFNFGKEELATITIVVPRSMITDSPNPSVLIAKSIPTEPKYYTGGISAGSITIPNPPELKTVLNVDGESIEVDKKILEIAATSDEDFKKLFGGKVDNHPQETTESPSADDSPSTVFLVATHDRNNNEVIQLGQYGSVKCHDLMKSLKFDPEAVQLILDGKQKTHKGYKFKIEER